MSDFETAHIVSFTKEGALHSGTASVSAHDREALRLHMKGDF